MCGLDPRILHRWFNPDDGLPGRAWSSLAMTSCGCVTPTENALPPELARHHVLAAQVFVAAFRRGENLAAHGGAQAIRRMPGHVPAAWTAGEFGPVLGRVGHIGRLVDLLHLGGVFG